MTTTKTITRRSRNLGIGWSNTPTRDGRYIEPVTEPSVVGTLRAVAAEYDRARKLHAGGTYCTAAFFVCGERVVAEDFLLAMSSLLAPGQRDDWGHTPRYLADSATVTVVA